MEHVFRSDRSPEIRGRSESPTRRVTPKTEKSPAGTECTNQFAQKKKHYGRVTMTPPIVFIDHATKKEQKINKTEKPSSK